MIRAFRAFSARVRFDCAAKTFCWKVAICVCVCVTSTSEKALLHLTAVAGVLLLRQSYGFNLNGEIAVGELEFPIGLNGLRHHLDDALPELLIGERQIFACHLNAMAIVVEAESHRQSG